MLHYNGRGCLSSKSILSYVIFCISDVSKWQPWTLALVCRKFWPSDLPVRWAYVCFKRLAMFRFFYNFSLDQRFELKWLYESELKCTVIWTIELVLNGNRDISNVYPAKFGEVYVVLEQLLRVKGSRGQKFWTRTSTVESRADER